MHKTLTRRGTIIHCATCDPRYEDERDYGNGHAATWAADHIRAGHDVGPVWTDCEGRKAWRDEYIRGGSDDAIARFAAWLGSL